MFHDKRCFLASTAGSANVLAIDERECLSLQRSAHVVTLRGLENHVIYTRNDGLSLVQ
jgi:hypothetical protein